MKTQIDKEVLYSGKVTNGFVMLAVVILLIPAIIAAGFVFLPFELWWLAGVIAGIGLLTMLTLSCGLFVLQPNQARVMIFFGEYQGTFRETGYFWVNPFMTKKKISLRIRNMDIAPIKVNDKVGNPVMIGMILVWKVKDTYRAVFDIDADPAPIVAVDTNEKGSAAAPTNTIAKALNAFVGIQSDAALREVTGRYAYDEENGKHTEITLRSDANEINEQLEEKLNERLAMAGIEVVEARLNHLAYAPEIAAVMLRRQQAEAVIAARRKIVEGAVGMVEMAVNELARGGAVDLDDERRATMASNLMVVLCGDSEAHPVVNTGSLY